jgi:serine/threonine-protein kinase HipA
MRSAKVYRNDEFVGFLIQHNSENYEFIYDDVWFANSLKPAVSLTLPKSQKIHKSAYLFPFFFNMISEGVNKQLQCRQFKIDEKNFFDLLLATASVDTIGAITVLPDRNENL